jgi:ribosomal protein S18 acetylase RimI-like enzyme
MQLSCGKRDCGDNPVPFFTLGTPCQAFLMSSTSHYEIRPATLRDARAIADIHAEASQAAFKELLASDQLSAIAVDKRLAYWRDAIEYSEPQVQVALYAGAVVGFVGFDRSRDTGTPPTTGEIWAIYLQPAHWGHGAGLALWDAAREGLIEEGCSQVTVWVPLSDERALRFFELAGFKRQMNSIKTVPVGSARIEEIRLKRALT